MSDNLHSTFRIDQTLLTVATMQPVTIQHAEANVVAA
jgi:hypothetical protein